MRLFKKTCCLFLVGVFALLIGYMPFSVRALSTTPIATETKIISQASIEDNFVDNRVLVVLTNEASLKFKTYTAEDFPEIVCKETRELTEAVTPSVRLCVEGGAETQGTNAVKISTQDPSTFNQILCLELPGNSKAGVLEAIAALQKRDDVLYVGPDYYMYGHSTVPNDSFIGDQWAVNKISLPLAWDITTGSSSVTVGVVDSGISSVHPDLLGNLNIGLSYDFVTNQPCGTSIYAPAIHGTQVAGIIGAVGNNKSGVAGVCWDVTLISLRVLGENLGGYMSDVIEAINYAESKNIDVLNLSLGNPEIPSSDTSPMYAAIGNYSGLLVCSAGNDNSDNDETPIYPAQLPFSNIISVGASTEADQRWIDPDPKYNRGSNYGEFSVDLFAPGDNIQTTAGATYVPFDRTSAATPFVTGVAALLLSIHPELTPAQLRQVIMDNVDQVAAFADICVSGGRLNAYKALCDDSIHSYAGNASGHSCSGANCSYSEPHTYTATRHNASQHKLYCAQCSYTTYANHTYLIGGTMCTVCGYSSSGFEQMGADDVICVMA